MYETVKPGQNKTFYLWKLYLIAAGLHYFTLIAIFAVNVWNIVTLKY